MQPLALTVSDSHVLSSTLMRPRRLSCPLVDSCTLLSTFIRYHRFPCPLIDRLSCMNSHRLSCAHVALHALSEALQYSLSWTLVNSRQLLLPFDSGFRFLKKTQGKSRCFPYKSVSLPKDSERGQFF